MARQRATSTEEIVAAAAAVFETKGYRNTTIDDICEAAGVSRPTVYKYIESKPWLLEQAVIAVTEELGGKLYSVRHGPGTAREKLRKLVRLHIDSAVKKRVYYAAMMTETTELPERAHKTYREWSRQVTHDCAELVAASMKESGVDGRLDPTVVTNLLLTMLSAVVPGIDED